MDIAVLFGNKTKVDILKYLLFKQEGLSARELENHLKQSFPAIKKQLDNLEQAGVISKNKTGNRWNVVILKEVKPLLLRFFLFDIKIFIKKFLEEFEFVYEYYYGDLFFPNSQIKCGADLIIILTKKNIDLERLKSKLGEFFDSYFLDVKIVFFELNDYQRRLRYADKFFLKVVELNKTNECF